MVWPALPLQGKVALVTGALGLLGQEHCRALAAQGARVIACDLDAERCAAFAAGLPDSAGYGVDITDPGSLERLRDTALGRFGQLDVLVNNAAIDDKFESPAAAVELSKFENYPVELWRRSLEVNVTGTFLCCQILGAPMAERGHGSIVNVASTYGLVAPDQSLYRRADGSQRFYKSPAYPAGKGAVLQLTRFLAAYWGHRGVRVNALCPGGVENGQDQEFQANYARRTMLGRMAAATDYHGALVFLASDSSSYMTGASLVVDGGWTAW